MRVVFAGTPAFSLPCLRALLAADGVEVVGVYTGPERRAGRGRAPRLSAVKEAALAAGAVTVGGAGAAAVTDGAAQKSARKMSPKIPIFQPESLRDDAAVEALRRLRPDLMVVVAFGLLLPAAALAIPRLGCVNLHASLLPRWRGAAPIARAIEAGDAVTGVSLMQMDAGLDTGPVLAAARVGIGAHDTAGDLHDKLARLAARLLAENLRQFAAGELTATPQDDARACHAPKLTKAEAQLDWRRDAAALERQVRAFQPWPVAFAEVGGLRLRALRAAVGAAPAGARRGEIVAANADGIVIAAGRGALALTVVQRPGGRAMTAGDFLNGAKITAGMRCVVAGSAADGAAGDAKTALGDTAGTVVAAETAAESPTTP
ncbi:MAG: methionyl-tRNA formyltransferase [Gammaproteobacteria bacterium]|nr:methionyl-tRNA formyltransferase [Gammaproteobacteria bacterium]